MARLLKGLVLAVLLLAAVAGGAALYQHYSYKLDLVATGTGGIEVVTAGEVAPDMLADIKASAAQFNAFTQEQMAYTLQHHVKVYAAGTEADYEQVLQKAFDLSAEEAQAIGSISGGWTGGSRHVTAINGTAGVMTERSDRWSTTGHELFHQMQYELAEGGDTEAKAFFWLEEGSADYVGALLAERMGGKTVQKWQRDTLDALLAVPTLVKISDLQHADMNARKQLMQPQFHSYQVADLMTCYLLTQYGAQNPCAKLAAYFRALKTAPDGETAFQDAFGIDSKTFLQVYASWWAQQRETAASVHFTVRPGAPAVQEALQQQFAAARQLAEARLGVRLHGVYDVVLASDKNDMAAAAAQWCGVSQDKAQQVAGASLWLENGSTIIINASDLKEARQQQFTMGVLASRMLAAQISGPNTDNKGIVWLERGMGYLMGVARLSANGAGTLQQYTQAWRRDIRQQGGVPQLTMLATNDGWSQASAQYSNDAISDITQLACAQLLQQYGWAGYRHYLQQLNRPQDATKAFQTAYGRTPKAFAQAWQQAQGL